MASNGDDGWSFDKQVPRPAKSPAKTAQIRIQNRRREYLERNPSYFTGLDHELADPVLYARLIKRHQTAEERQKEGKEKGYGRVLEADLARGETRLSALATEAAGEPSHEQPQPRRWKATADTDNSWDSQATSKEHGRELWREFLKERFIQGGDDEFDYVHVDENEEYDAVARREAEDAWFEDEEPSWEDEMDQRSQKEGETGIQDF